MKSEARISKSEARIAHDSSNISEIIKRLKKAFPDPKIALSFSNPLELLVAVILSAQTTDAGINSLTPALFARYRTAQDYAQANTADLEKMVKRSGFYHAKAQHLIGMGKRLLTDFDGKVPQTMEELTTIPGVGRKSANVVLWNAFRRIEGIAVDTHVMRLSQRLGLTREMDPVKIESDLMKIVPKRDWGKFAHLLQAHGRTTCIARSPKCESCFLQDICPSASMFLFSKAGSTAKRTSIATRRGKGG